MTRVLVVVALVVAALLVAPSAACEAEDANNCVWLAAVMGSNHAGRSFVNVAGVVVYL